MVPVILVLQRALLLNTGLQYTSY